MVLTHQFNDFEGQNLNARPGPRDRARDRRVKEREARQLP